VALSALFLSALFLTGSAFAEKSLFESSTASYLLRLERSRADVDVCVMVRGDGQYHLERQWAEKTDVFEGTLRLSELQFLEHIVDQDQLFYLKQDEISAPLMSQGLDRVALAVLRPGHWQSLNFYAPESRKPFASLLDPLLKWLNEVQGEKHIKLRAEEAEDHCLPDASVHLKIRGSNRPVEERGASSQQQDKPALPGYTFFMTRTSIKKIQAEKTCIIVKPDGRYHVERRDQRAGDSTISSNIFEGSVGSAGMQQLQQLLDAPELRNRTDDDDPQDQTLQELDLTHLMIPRNGHVQQISFWRYLRPFVVGRAAVRDNGTNLLDPLNQWISANLEENRATALPADKSLAVCREPGPN
jgi:hypothetical protein